MTTPSTPTDTSRSTAGTAAPLPMLSVVVPLYNKGPYIARCLQSIRSQTVASLEVFVVDDGSTDDGAAIAESFALADPRITVIRQPNGGVSRARNVGLARARADWVAFLDADDEWSPRFVETLRRAIDGHAGATLVGTAYTSMPATPGGAPERIDYGFDPFLRYDVDFDVYARWQRGGSCPFWTSATAMRRDALRAVGGYPEGISLGEDLLLFLAIFKTGSYVFINEPLAFYHQDTTTSLARSPSLRTILTHERLLDELDRLVAAGTFPIELRDHHRDIHAYHLTASGNRSELWRFLMRTPAHWPARVYARALLESLGLRQVLKRLRQRHDQRTALGTSHSS